MKIAALLILGVSTLAACSIAPEDELDRKGEALLTLPPGAITSPLPLIPGGPIFILPPTWANACTNSGAPANRFFVRRSGGCPNITATGGYWDGNNVFEANSGYCSYKWISSGGGPAYSALSAVAGVYPKTGSRLGSGETAPGIVRDCMPAQSACVLPDGMASYPPTLSPYPYSGKCVYRTPVLIPPGYGPLDLYKGIQPCGACGRSRGSWTQVIVPWEWVDNDVTVVPWDGSRYAPGGQQAFWVYNPGTWPYIAEARDSSVDEAPALSEYAWP